MRRLAPLLSATLLVGLLPGNVAAAAPVAVDDPGIACQDPSLFGGSFPIPEDFSGGEPGFERYFLIFGDSLSPGSCGLLENDTDPDGDPLSIASVIGGQHGSVIQVDATSVAYLPEPDWSTPAGDWASDAIYYTATDGTTESNTAHMTFWLAPINDPPTFTPGGDVEVSSGSGPYSAAWASAIEPGPDNEADQTVSFEVVSIDAGGVSLFTIDPVIASDGTLTFTPATGAAGIAQVTVQATDDGGLESYGLPAGTMDPPDDTSDAVTFTIVVTAVEDHDPLPVADSATVVEDGGELSIDVLANDDDPDGDPLTVTAVEPATKGSASVAPDGSAVSYIPDPDAFGTDTFDYLVEDGTGRTASATVTVTITPVQDVPVASDDEASVSQGGAAIAIPVLANDIDADGDALRITSVSGGKRGTVTITGGGTGLTYDPFANKHGTDTFTYTVSDGHGGVDTATVSVSIVRPR
jgi:hypothetical protein